MSKPFKCRLCGECCSGDMKVFLNPDDLNLLSAYLGNCSGEELFLRRYVTWDEKSGVKQPRLLFKEFQGIGFCPFLENRLEEDGTLKGLCQLHPHYKPLVCHLAPLTRSVDFETDREEFGFILPHPSCPGCEPDEEGREELNYASLPEEIKSRLRREKEHFRTLWLAPDD
ncbi:MAG: YkgJ family cysteine cluster protein [Spirochaetales bacterium]|nr:YkgJ family cysteine cluster protein [Spirochaetales bacterium]